MHNILIFMGITVGGLTLWQVSTFRFNYSQRKGDFIQNRIAFQNSNNHETDIQSSIFNAALLYSNNGNIACC